MRQSYASSAYAQARLRLRPPSAYAPFSQFRDCRSPSRTAVLLTIRASTFITATIIANVRFVYNILTYTKNAKNCRFFLCVIDHIFMFFRLVSPFSLHSSSGRRNSRRKIHRHPSRKGRLYSFRCLFTAESKGGCASVRQPASSMARSVSQRSDPCTTWSSRQS